jgi:deoxyxylulose-5-phosphate synthase
VLNDNDMSISTNVGAISGYLNQIIKGQRYNQPEGSRARRDGS